MKYRKKETVIAIQLNLELKDGIFEYEAWGGPQTARRGDWLINRNGEEVYTCEADVFAETYEKVSPGVYRKTAAVEADECLADCKIDTLEGQSDCKAGDFVVTNPGGDRYPVERGIFLDIYEPMEG